ncbi:MAG TPA: YqhV family protein [Firmicutes bacterium]|jgi:hypothetical protein|nr:YqhV family protein [Bacillota bacterium]
MQGTLLGMVFLRLLSGSVEIIAALLIFRLNCLEKALKINAILASVGPLVFLAAMYLGLTGLSRQIPLQKMVYIYLGVALIFIGLRH